MPAIRELPILITPIFASPASRLLHQWQLQPCAFRLAPKCTKRMKLLTPRQTARERFSRCTTTRDVCQKGERFPSGQRRAVPRSDAIDGVGPSPDDGCQHDARKRSETRKCGTMGGSLLTSPVLRDLGTRDRPLTVVPFTLEQSASPQTRSCRSFGSPGNVIINRRELTRGTY